MVLQRQEPVRIRKKPLELRAIRWTGSNLDEVQAFVDADDFYVAGNALHLRTFHGNVVADKGDWIIEQVGGAEYYPCRPEILAMTYDVIEEEPEPDPSPAGWPPRERQPVRGHSRPATA
ncbi:MAG: hypothetical protein ACRDPK_21015 [Carbonactinosporaceae bacterium]